MRRAAWIVIALASAGCDDVPPAPGTSLGTVVVPSGRSATPQASGAPPAPAPRGEPPALPPGSVEACRATSISGSVTRFEGGTAVTKHDSLDDAPWLSIGDGASIGIKHARTAREVTLVGPGLVMPCYRHGESFLVNRGALRATPGAGARPGAEVLVATPDGLVRYADAALDVVVREQSLQVTVRSGSAVFEGVAPGSPHSIRPGKAFVHDGTRPSVKSLVDSCTRAAQSASDAASRVKERDARGKTLGERAARHFHARRMARKACGIAAAAVGPRSAAPGDWEMLDAAERLWRGLAPAKRSSNNANFR